MKPRKQIALVFPMGVEHLEEVMYGIRSYAKEKGGWMFVTSPETHSLTVNDLEGWQGDGAIGLVNSKKDLEKIRELKLPFVNCSGAVQDIPLPRVRVDYRVIGEKAAAYLLKKGYRNFAYYGLKNTWYSDEIVGGYEAGLSDTAESFNSLFTKSSIATKQPLVANAARLEAWLNELPKPVVIMTPHDPRGVEVIQTCFRIGIKVPDEVAVLSSNNDIRTCTYAEPQMSSIARNGEAIGREAALLLSRLMKGERVSKKDTVIQPLDVVERESTNFLAIHNDTFQQIVDYIQDNIHEPFTIDELCYEFERTRRWLEYSFKENLHQSPYNFILNLRIDRVKTLLADEEKHKISAIADMSGFNSTHQMNVAFKKHIGCSPREYRTNLENSA